MVAGYRVVAGTPTAPKTGSVPEVWFEGATVAGLGCRQQSRELHRSASRCDAPRAGNASEWAVAGLRGGTDPEMRMEEGREEC